jgi:replication-associated recombination protein RarA
VAKFQPSSESHGSPEWGEKTLKYIKIAVAHIEAEPKEEIPPWVRNRLSEAATSLGMAVKYLQNQKENKARARKKK